MVAGLAIESVAWWFVSFRRRDVWRVTVPALASMGVAALVLGPAWSPEVEPAVAAASGAASGAGLYLATRVFVVVVRRWEAFQRQSLAMYLRQGSRSLAGALVLSVAVSVPGEELFWRGLFQPELVDAFGGRAGLAAVVGWAAFVAANLASWNLAILAGAVVGGAVWSALGWWTGGALAPLASHAVWTALMLSFPVVRSADVRA
ncbi:MAG: CPBP family glutamic-type intramembrane protease [Candidatus Rokuibacteriota bacterium]